MIGSLHHSPRECVVWPRRIKAHKWCRPSRWPWRVLRYSSVQMSCTDGKRWKNLMQRSLHVLCQSLKVSSWQSLQAEFFQNPSMLHCQLNIPIYKKIAHSVINPCYRQTYRSVRTLVIGKIAWTEQLSRTAATTNWEKSVSVTNSVTGTGIFSLIICLMKWK